MSRFLLAFCLLSAAPLGAQPQPTAAEAATPVEVGAPIRAIISQLNTARGPNGWKNYWSFDGKDTIVGARAGVFGAHLWMRWWNENGYEIRFDNAQILERGDGTLKVQANYQLVKNTPLLAPVVDENGEVEKAPAPPAQTLTPANETLFLRFDAGKNRWLVAPEKPAAREFLRGSPLRFAAYFGAQSDEARVVLNEEISQQNLKACALGALQFSQDFDEIFAFAPDLWTVALVPYIQNERVFTRPDDGKTYAFNPFLSGKSLNAIEKAAETVLFYEGEWEQLTFRENGQTAVCFADGHVELVDEKRAKTLIWKP